jgi:phosphoribosylanthranilate isomerase
VEVFLKICGITRVEDALHAVRHGATALGFVFWPKSPRAVGVEQARAIVDALPRGLTTVGVFVNASAGEISRAMEASGVTAVQFHGDESPEDVASVTALGCPVLRSVDVARAPEIAAAWPEPTLLLLDAYDPERRGGTGMTVDWVRAAEVARRRRVVLAGGLTPESVAGAIAAVHPFGVDVSSGVEHAPGLKDAEKVARFLAHARSAFEAVHA